MFTDSISQVLTKTHDFLSHVPLELEFIEGLISMPRNLKMNVNLEVKWENCSSKERYLAMPRYLRFYIPKKKLLLLKTNL